MCTYNGSSFLREQLDSIAAQIRLPDELIVCDDRSTDETVEIVREFSRRVIFPVIILQNEQNLGSTKNFEQAIKNCKSDIIALSDQDDVWLPQKLERIAAEFEADPKVGLVFSDATLTDENLRPIGRRLWIETFRPRDQKAFTNGRAIDVLLQYNVVTGATMAFRSMILQAILPIPEFTEFIHDGWISLVSAMCSRIRFIRDPLIKYRQHSGQQLGAGLRRWQISRAERYSMTLEDRHIAIQRLEDYLLILSSEKLALMQSVAPERSRVPDTAALIQLIEEARCCIGGNVEHINARSSLPSSRMLRLPGVLREFETGRYGLFSRGWQSAILDLIRK